MAALTKKSLLLAGGALAAGGAILLVARKAKADDSESDSSSADGGPVPKPEIKQVVVTKLPDLPKPPKPGSGTIGPAIGPGTVNAPARAEISREQVRQAVDALRFQKWDNIEKTPGWDDWVRGVLNYGYANMNTQRPSTSELNAPEANWNSLMKRVKDDIEDYASEKTAGDVEFMSKLWNKVFSSTKKWKKPGSDRTPRDVLQDLLKQKKRKEEWRPWAGEGANSGVVADYIANWALEIAHRGLPMLWLDRQIAGEACLGEGNSTEYTLMRCIARDKIVEEALDLPRALGPRGQLKDDREKEFITSKSPSYIANDWFTEAWTRDQWAGVGGSIKGNSGLRARMYDAFTHMWPVLLARFARYDRYKQ